MSDTETKTIPDRVIPNTLASRPRGRRWVASSSAMVVLPPVIMAQNAAVLEDRFQNSAPMTGTNNPETIKA